ncbi:MAG: amidohydrolase [Propionicimonas sp.]|uniref:amidohydrolase n=1 Tax=Propionicimonas sp. TaxID=1955623 RepID=UPI003D0F024E
MPGQTVHIGERVVRVGADLLFTNGPVWLGPGLRTDALAVTAGRISALGADATAAGATEVVDLDGGLLLPAFSDGHCHPPQAGMEKLGPSISDLDSVEAIVAEVGRYAAAHPELGWIVGGSYEPALAPGGSFHAAWLDAVVADRPVLLRAHDYHTVWCNSRALEVAGVDASTPQPATGLIDRFADGRPVGTLREPEAYTLVDRFAPSPTPAVWADALRLACADMAAVGVTWMQDAWVDEGGHRPYLALLGRGELGVRTNLAWLAEPDCWRDQLAVFVAQREEVAAAGAPRLLTGDTVKFFADGVIESATAEMLEPYLDTHDHGRAVWPPDELARAVAAIDALGFQTHIHAIGDAAVRHALDAIEHATRTNPDRDRRPVITHVQLAEASDLARFAPLGVVAAMQTYWAQHDALMDELTAPRLGPDRTDRQYPVATLLGLGARVSIASDWPVSTNSPLEALTVAATRQNDAGLPVGGWMPHERLPLEAGLLAATATGAYQGFTDAFRGSLTVGRDADLVQLDRDVTAADPALARTAEVRGTWLAGTATHQR